MDRADDRRERVTVAARVRTFDGQVSSRRLVFTLTRRDGRWFIQEWRARRPRKGAASVGHAFRRASRDFELRELRAQRLLPDRDEPHDQLGVVVQRLDAEDGADAERGCRTRVPGFRPDGTDWSSSS